MTVCSVIGQKENRDFNSAMSRLLQNLKVLLVIIIIQKEIYGNLGVSQEHLCGQMYRTEAAKLHCFKAIICTQVHVKYVR